MLNLITGVPGASKTAYVVTQLDSIERQNKINLEKNKITYQDNQHLFKKFRDDFSYYEIEVGSGHELKNEIEFLADDYFSFLDEDFDDLRPDYYFLRSIRYNEIIERIEDREGDQGFKPFQPVRTIYTNIKALKIEYARANVYDWRTCPDGSIIVIDEIQLVEPYASTKIKDEIVMELTTHRHRGFDF
ncbi:TPA: zonular occludens toxin domain-containing protein, partial [Acinetobacter baumannii]